MDSKELQNYFEAMSLEQTAPGHMYIINQRGRGIGNSRRGKMMYKVKTPQSQIGHGIQPTIISPVEQSIRQAKEMLKRGKTQSRSHSSSKRQRVKSYSKSRSRSRSKSKSRSRSKNRSRSKKKTPRRVNKKKSKKTKKKRQKNYSDIFSRRRK